METVGFEVVSVPRNSYASELAASLVVPGNIVVYGFIVYSTKGSAQYLNVFNASALPADTAVPIFSWPLAANNGVGFGYQPNGRHFTSGLVLCNSSTDATKTIGSADCFFDVQYDVVSGAPE